MIELPEAAVIARQVKEQLKGKKIESVIANYTPHKFANYTGDPDKYDDILKGKIITDAYAVANHIYFVIEDMTLIVNTPVSYFIKSQSMPANHQLYLKFTDEDFITCTIRMWGVFYLFKTDQKEEYGYDVEKNKPSPLSNEFTKTYFNNLFVSVKNTLSVKAFLTTEQRIPGLGNGVLQDILWHAKINPKCKLSKMTTDQVENLYESIVKTLKEMEKLGGRCSEKDLFSKYGGYQTIMCDKNISNPCPVCGSKIVKSSYMGGNVYYCVECQKDD